MTKDLTKGRPLAVLMAFSLPMLIGNLFQQLYNLIDLMIVGRFLGVDALAAVGATSSSMFFLFSLVIGLTNGAAVVISQYYGFGDTLNVKRSIVTTIHLNLLAAVLLTVLGSLLTKPLLRLLGTPEDLLGTATLYLVIIMAGAVATIAYNTIASIARALGNSVVPLVFLIVAVILNIGLDLLLIVVIPLGVAGAAIATVLAQAIAAVACTAYCAKTMPMLWLNRSDLRTVDRFIMNQTIRVGLPGALQMALISMGNMVVQRAINGFGPDVMAAAAAAMKVDQLATQPLLTLGMAGATYSAQNVGAGRLDRVRQGVRSIVVVCGVFSVAMAVLFHIFGNSLMSLFVEGEAQFVITAGAQYLRVVSIFYIVLGILICLEHVLRGAGDVFWATVSCAVEILARLAVAYGLSIPLGYLGIWFSGPAAWITGMIIITWRYRSGAWANKALVGGEKSITPSNNTESITKTENPGENQ